MFGSGYRGAIVGVFSLMGLLGLQSGCETSCSVDGDQEPDVVTTGSHPREGVYESAPWDGEYLKFPPQKRYEFEHGLGAIPVTVNAYVAFEDPPIGVAESAGNIVIIEKTTSTFVRVRNDTCETFYLRVTASL